MRSEPSKALDKCLSRISKGDAMETCLAEYPHLRQQLEPLLKTALSISTVARVSPSREFAVVSRIRLMAQLHERLIRAKAAKRPREAQAKALRIRWRRLVHAPIGPRALSFVGTLLLLIAIGGSLFMIVSLSSSSQPAALASQCTLSVLSGSAEVQMLGSKTWQQAEDGMTLPAGSRVKTAEDSHAALTFFEGSSIKLEPCSDIEIQRVESAEGGGTEIALKQWLGTTWSRVVKMVDPGSSYEIQTPSAVALVRGTLFETEVDETGLTTVRTTEGLVSVSAQNKEVLLLAGQEVTVEFGAPPSEPQSAPPADTEVVIAVSMPAVASVCDPTSSSTGYLPNGLAFNQITGAQSTSPSEGAQVITIPNPVPGEYSVVLRCIADGTSQVNLACLYKGESVFTHASAHEVTDGSAWLISFRLQVEGGEFISAAMGHIEPLSRAPEKIVETELAEASLVLIEPPEGSGQAADTERNYTLAVVSSAGGTVTEPGQGVLFYPAGAVVDLIAEPDEGWEFDSWTGKVADRFSPVTTITMNQAQVVTASFVLGD